MLNTAANNPAHIHETATQIQISIGKLGLLSNPAGLWIVIGWCFAVYIGVVLPAVWSRKAARRKAALAVLDRILPRKRRSS
jgi:hypothetical protein